MKLRPLVMLASLLSIFSFARAEPLKVGDAAPAVSGITSGFDSAPPKWLGNSSHGTSAMWRTKALRFSQARML